MLIEIFKDSNWFISSIRYWWSKNPKNKPRKDNTYKIYKKDLPKIIEFIIGWTAYIDNKTPVLSSWNLNLNNLDYQKKIDHKFINHIL